MAIFKPIENISTVIPVTPGIAQWTGNPTVPVIPVPSGKFFPINPLPGGTGGGSWAI
jgi:hypothetical protein